MVCEGGRPCERWLVFTLCLTKEGLIGSIKRDISHLCRDASPPKDLPPKDPSPSISLAGGRKDWPEEYQDIKPIIPQQASTSQLPPQLYSDPNFPPSWPLLPDTSTNTGATFVDGTVGNGVKGNGWGMNDESELGALSYVIGTR
jgi:hypothetical protein